jgi:hypothetical protein
MLDSGTNFGLISIRLFLLLGEWMIAVGTFMTVTVKPHQLQNLLNLLATISTICPKLITLVIFIKELS